MSETLLDVKGMNCPLPVLRANRTLRGLAPGQRLRVVATDRAAVADFQAFCQETGHALLAWSEEAGVFSFLIRRRPESEQPNADGLRTDDGRQSAHPETPVQAPPADVNPARQGPRSSATPARPAPRSGATLARKDG